MSPASSAKRFTNDQRAYIYARIVLFCILALLQLVDVINPENLIDTRLYLATLGLLGVDTVVFLFLVMKAQVDFGRAMIWVLPPDLLMVAAFTYLGTPDDAFYPVCILIPVMFAILLQRRQAWAVGAATAVAYGIGHSMGRSIAPVDVVLITLKALAIPLIGAIVASSVHKQRQRELEVKQVALQREELNNLLRRRVAELQAVSEITEIIHSSLEFDRVGPIVLDIVAKAIDVEPCCLFVIDKEKSETLFSATVGVISAAATPMSMAGLDDEGLDNHFSCVPVFDHAEMIVLFCATADDIARLTPEDKLVVGAVASELVVAVENSRLYRLTKHLAITDELTDLFNYRYLQQRLDDEVGRALRYDKSVSLLMFDVDDFKKFNDTHGHLAGDVALSDFGAILRANIRDVDVAARYGGEEFSVILPETDASGAYIVAEKIREAVSEHLFADADGRRCCNLTVSVGLATMPTHGADKESLLREADDAVYNAKSGGKNRVRTPARNAKPAMGTRESDEPTGVELR